MLHMQVSFTSGYSILLNRQNFEWNRTDFSENFKNTSTAGEFISVWNKVTKLHGSMGFAEPITDAMDNSSAASSQSSGGPVVAPTNVNKRPSSDLDSSLPLSKRPTVPSQLNTDSSHANQIDDRILSKRKGSMIYKKYLFLGTQQNLIKYSL